jgi:hypothetical protein
MSELDPAPEPEVIDKPIDEPAKDIPQDKAVDPPVVVKDAKPEPGAAKDAPKDEPKDVDKPDDFAWPDDWRERVADGDDDLAKELSRYGSMKNVVKALREAKATIRSGKLTKPMPDASDEKAMAEWRKEQGIPDDPSGYKLPDTVTKALTDEDKPVLATFTEFAHKKGLPNSAVEVATEWYVSTMDQIAEQRAAADNEARESAEDALRKDWAHGEYKANLTLASRTIEGIPGVGKGWAEFRGPDGRRLGDNPEFIAWAADMGRNQFGDVTFANGDSERKHTARREEIEKLMATDIHAYRSDPKIAAEYEAIIARDLKRGKK